jgi:hypothetical protein
MSHDIPAQTSIFATNVAASAWWVGDLLYRHGPSWQLVPPILIGAASLVGAIRGYANDRQARKHRDELHQIELMRRKGSS